MINRNKLSVNSWLSMQAVLTSALPPTTDFHDNAVQYFFLTCHVLHGDAARDMNTDRRQAEREKLLLSAITHYNKSSDA